jgi:signal peptidase II
LLGNIEMFAVWPPVGRRSECERSSEHLRSLEPFRQSGVLAGTAPAAFLYKVTMTPKARYFWPLLLILFVTDCSTKDLAVDRLDPAPASQPIVDSFLRLTLVHNPGTAFGFDLRPYLGVWARPALVAVMVGVLAALMVFYQRTAPRARLVAAALGLTAGGAIGNLVDRLRFASGVVDFIDVGFGAHRFWIFNIADAGITIGALLLALLLLRESDPSHVTRPAV